MKQRTNIIGKSGRQLLMATLLTTGLALTGAGQAEAHPDNSSLPSPEFGKPVSPPLARQPTAGYGYRPVPPPPHGHPPPPAASSKKQPWFFWPWW